MNNFESLNSRWFLSSTFFHENSNFVKCIFPHFDFYKTSIFWPVLKLRWKSLFPTKVFSHLRVFIRPHFEFISQIWVVIKRPLKCFTPCFIIYICLIHLLYSKILKSLSVELKKKAIRKKSPTSKRKFTDWSKFLENR